MHDCVAQNSNCCRCCVWSKCSYLFCVSSSGIGLIGNIFSLKFRENIFFCSNSQRPYRISYWILLKWIWINIRIEFMKKHSMIHASWHGHCTLSNNIWRFCTKIDHIWHAYLWQKWTICKTEQCKNETNADTNTYVPSLLELIPFLMHFIGHFDKSQKLNWLKLKCLAWDIVLNFDKPFIFCFCHMCETTLFQFAVCSLFYFHFYLFLPIFFPIIFGLCFGKH